jgi:hypothetical protein
MIASRHCDGERSEAGSNPGLQMTPLDRHGACAPRDDGFGAPGPPASLRKEAGAARRPGVIFWRRFIFSDN